MSHLSYECVKFNNLFDILGLHVEQELPDFCKEEQVVDEFVANNFNEESRDNDAYSTESELDCLAEMEEVTNCSKEKFNQGNSILPCIKFYQLK